MRALLDTDVVLDVITERAPFAVAAAELLDLNEQGLFEAYISAITPINIFYIARKAKSSPDLKQAVKHLLQAVRVCPIDHRCMTRISPNEVFDKAVEMIYDTMPNEKISE